MPMDDESRPVPRFVPTLTEVVQTTDAVAGGHVPEPSATSAPPGDAVVSARMASAATPGAGVPDGAAGVLACLGPELEQRIAETVGRVLHDQMLGFNARVRKAVAEVVHETLAKAVAQGIGVSDVGENPQNRPPGT